MTNPALISISADGVGTVTGIMDEYPTVITGGLAGGWTTIARQRRKALTQWAGKDPMRLKMSMLLDGYRVRESQEAAIGRMNVMALPPEDSGEPPPVQISGPGIPDTGIDHWVIESLTWKIDKVIWGKAANGVICRLRQDVEINLLELVDEDRVSFAALAPGSGFSTGKTVGWPKQYIAKPGDTLRIIASLFYKDSTKWKKIATANGMRDSKAVVAGATLRIPAP